MCVYMWIGGGRQYDRELRPTITAAQISPLISTENIISSLQPE